MAEILKLFAVVLGDAPVSRHMFPVKASGSISVGEFRELVHAKGPTTLERCKAADLVLWKLNTAIHVDRVDEDIVAFGQDPPAYAVEMLPAMDLSNYFISDPPGQSLHIIVRLPKSGQKRRRSSPLSDGDHEPFKRRRLALLPQSLTIYKAEADPGNADAPAVLPTQGGFHEMISLYNLIAADKTRYIELLDRAQRYHYMFLRPRRWGKSTFLQTLADYYDKANEGSFERYFGDLYIGKNPTSARNSLLVLLFNFSEVSGTGTREEMQRQFHRMVNYELKRFLERYQAFLGGLKLELLDHSDGTNALKQVLGLVEQQGEKLFVGVDEYDAPANTILFYPNQDGYRDVAEFLKSQFFSIMKQALFTVVEKYWITGVLPVFRDGVSPLTSVVIISEEPEYNGLCGLTDTEVREITQTYLSPSYQPLAIDRVLRLLKRWYNGHLFYRGEEKPEVESLYNPELVFNHLRGLATGAARLAPQEEINAAHTSNVLAAIPDTGDASFFETYLKMISSTIKTKVALQFGAPEVRQLGKDASITWSLLYFFGVLTHAPDGLHLKVPNVTIINVITRRFSRFLDKQSQLPNQSDAAYEGLLTRDVRPLIKLLEFFFGKEPARAVKDCNEAALRTAVSVFWSSPAGRCLPELSLLVDPRAPAGQGRSGFLDLLLPSSPSALCIELRNIPLDALWRGQYGHGNLTSNVPLERLRDDLRLETEDELLKRRVKYGNKENCVEEVKNEAFAQIRRYLEVMKNGVAGDERSGVHDHRVQESEGNGELIGYVVILLGGTRALGWHVTTEQTTFTWQVKANAKEDSLIS